MAALTEAAEESEVITVGMLRDGARHKGLRVGPLRVALVAAGAATRTDAQKIHKAELITKLLCALLDKNGGAGLDTLGGGEAAEPRLSAALAGPQSGIAQAGEPGVTEACGEAQGSCAARHTSSLRQILARRPAVAGTSARAPAYTARTPAAARPPAHRRGGARARSGRRRQRPQPRASPRAQQGPFRVRTGDAAGSIWRHCRVP